MIGSVTECKCVITKERANIASYKNITDCVNVIESFHAFVIVLDPKKG